VTIPSYNESALDGNAVVRSPRRRPIAAELRWIRRHGAPDVIGLCEACDEARHLAIELAVARAPLELAGARSPRNEALLCIAELLQAARRHRAALRAATRRRRA